MKLSEAQWKKQLCQELRFDAKRLIDRIDEMSDDDIECVYSQKMSAIKRASLEISKTGAKLRNGYWKSYREGK